MERPERFGGDVSYADYDKLEEDYAKKNLHPGDLKKMVGDYLVNIISPIRDKLVLDQELQDAIRKNV